LNGEVCWSRRSTFVIVPVELLIVRPRQSALEIDQVNAPCAGTVTLGVAGLVSVAVAAVGS